MGVESNFDELEREIEDLQGRTNGIADKTAKSLGEKMRTEVVNFLKRQNTVKGGTYYSTSSPYEPGGRNDSTGMNTHLIDDGDSGAWNVEKNGSGGQGGPIQYDFTPIVEVSDRAYYILNGTNEKSAPDGEYPMHFYYKGNHIIISDAPPDASNSTRWEREPSSRDGLESLNYIQAGLIPTRMAARNIAQARFHESVSESRGDILDFEKA